MRKRFDPSYLEPKDGDFASFVENPKMGTLQALLKNSIKKAFKN